MLWKANSLQHIDIKLIFNRWIGLQLVAQDHNRREKNYLFANTFTTNKLIFGAVIVKNRIDGHNDLLILTRNSLDDQNINMLSDHWCFSQQILLRNSRNPDRSCNYQSVIESNISRNLHRNVFTKRKNSHSYN